MKIKKGQAIGIVDDDEIVSAGDETNQVLLEALDKVNIESVEVVTLYYGSDIEATQAEEATQGIRSKYLGKQVELVHGGQPHYDYIISLE